MKFQLWAACLLAAGSLTLASCKKENEDPTQKASTETVQQSEDNTFVKGESDQINTDATTALENFPDLNGGRIGETELTKPICGCAIDSSNLAQKTIVLDFDGVTPCSSNPRRTRGGRIVVKLVRGQRWAEQDALLEIKLENYKVTRLSDNRSIQFNGTKYLRNVRGSRWLAVLAGTDSLVYAERGSNITATIDGNRTHTYSVARTQSYRFVQIYNATQVQIRATGDTAIDNVAAVDSWGTNRFGNAFTSAFSVPFMSNTYCGLWQPNQGTVVLRSNNNTLTLTMGVNQQGNPSTLDCAYGYKVSWNLAGGSQGEQVVSY